jgi:predicted phosphate transport protein (TIGR00153 family)
MFRSILPKETSFFDYFEQIGAQATECCKELLALTTEGGNLTPHANRIKEIEKEADKITHSCTDALHSTFITPIDRAHIHSLIKRLDDIIDSVDSATSRMDLYELTEIRLEAKQLAEVLVRATIEIEAALKKLRDLSHPEGINDHLIVIYRLENEGDAILRAALVRLFKEEANAVSVIKWKEIYERLEKATDRCESVASIIQGIVIEAS